MKKILIFAAVLSLIFTSCQKDNYAAPEATLSGTVNYNGTPVGVRTTGTELELWQDGFALNEKITVHIDQDGTYSARLFSGQYKLVRQEGAPWAPQLSDTIPVTVNGDTTFDVEVQPYFTLQNVAFQQYGNAVKADFTVNQVDTNADLTNVKLYASKDILLDDNHSDKSVSLDVNTVTSGDQSSLIVVLPDDLLNAGYLYFRVGVKSNLSNEYYYSQVEKLDIASDVALNPEASFTVTPYGLQQTFNNTSTNAVSYSWDFGDGTTSTEENPVHAYAAEGSYTVTLTATGDAGTLESTITQTVDVGYTPIDVLNGDFTLPGTADIIIGWDNNPDYGDIPGWTSDQDLDDCGVFKYSVDPVVPDNGTTYFGKNRNQDGPIYNLTDHVISDGQTFKLVVDLIDLYYGDSEIRIYYDTGDGNRNVFATLACTPYVDAGYRNGWVTYEVVGVAPPAAVGAKVGVSIKTTMLAPCCNDGWAGVDNVKMFFK